MTIVANYYEKNGNPNERMEAHYLLGCVYRDLGEAPKALSVFHDAVDFADTTDVDCDYALLSRVHAQMADLLEKIQLPYDALIESRHSVRNAYKAKDTLMAISSEAYQSNVYYLIGKLDSVIDIGERVFKSFLRFGDTLYAFYYLNPAISAYLELGNMREAKSLIDIQDDLYYKNYGSGSISKSMNSASINRGEYYRKSNNMDSARYYYSLANPPSSPNNALLLIIATFAAFFLTNN